MVVHVHFGAKRWASYTAAAQFTELVLGGCCFKFPDQLGIWVMETGQEIPSFSNYCQCALEQGSCTLCCRFNLRWQSVKLLEWLLQKDQILCCEIFHYVDLYMQFITTFEYQSIVLQIVIRKSLWPKWFVLHVLQLCQSELTGDHVQFRLKRCILGTE